MANFDWTAVAIFLAPGVAVALMLMGYGFKTYLEARGIAVAINAAARLAEADNARRALSHPAKTEGGGDEHS